MLQRWKQNYEGAEKKITNIITTEMKGHVTGTETKLQRSRKRKKNIKTIASEIEEYGTAITRNSKRKKNYKNNYYRDGGACYSEGNKITKEQKYEKKITKQLLQR